MILQIELKLIALCVSDQDNTVHRVIGSLSGLHHKLHHHLPALVEHPPTVRHDDDELTDRQVPAGAAASPGEELRGQAEQGHQAGLLLKCELVLYFLPRTL